MSDRLAELLAELGRRLPASRGTAWKAVLDAARGPDDPVLDQLASSPAAGLAQHWDAIRRAWRDEAPGLPGAGLALALAAVSAHETSDGQGTELVVSGPVSPSIPVRLTSEIAVEVIRSAEESLLIASFAARGVAEILAELRQAFARGVEVDLLLEESTSAADAFASLGSRLRVWHWGAQATGGLLHAKLIAADRRVALLGSANLTNRALNDNVEIGVVLRDSRAVGRLVDHFRWLMAPGNGFLRRA